MYNDTATVTTTDLCGDAWGGAGVINSSSNASLTISAPPPEFGVDAGVFAPLTSSAYETVQCAVTSAAIGNGNQGKVLSSPGTVHTAAIVNYGTGYSGGGQDLTNLKIQISERL